MKRMLDLYSGLGGASEAFVKAGWQVDRLENNGLLTDPKSEFCVEGTTHQDVLTWDFHKLPPCTYDFIWASPPCLEFSQAYRAPAMVAKREGREFKPDLSLLARAKEIIDWFKPEWWVIENVRGASKPFSEFLQSPPRQIVGPFFLWGVFPFIQTETGWTHLKETRKKGDGGMSTWSDDPIRANRKGKIPFEISRQFLEGVTEQTRITEWIA